MKKRLFLLFCGVMCLFFVLCSCSCDTENVDSGDGDESHSHTHSSLSSGSSSTVTDSSSNIQGSNNGDITTPETPCELSESGHYWSQVKINKETMAKSTVAVSGICHFCGDELYKVCASVVDYEQLKKAFSKESLKSFTLVNGTEYTDYDESGAICWREKDKVYTADYYINSDTKNSLKQIESFSAYKLENFKYDGSTKTYKYVYDENSYAEFGFADGDFIYYSYTSKNGDKEQKIESLYLNHNRIKVEKPDFIIEKYNEAVTLQKLKDSKLDSYTAENIFEELKSFDFDSTFEAFLLENDRVSVYFPLKSPRVDPISKDSYSFASVLIEDSQVVSVSFGANTYSAK